MNDPHYSKKTGYSSYYPSDIFRMRNCNTCREDGKWIISRPIPYFSIVERLRQAWDVFRRRADALYWHEYDYPEYDIPIT